MNKRLSGESISGGNNLRGGPADNAKMETTLPRLASGNSVAKWNRNAAGNGNRPAVDFPCSLHSKQPIQLRDKSTMFFVLKARAFIGDSHVKS